jgi:hypothetical protein
MRYYKVAVQLRNAELLEILLGQRKLMDCPQYRVPNGLQIESILPNPLNGTLLVVFTALERECGPLRLFEVASGQEPPRLDYRDLVKE